MTVGCTVKRVLCVAGAVVTLALAGCGGGTSATNQGTSVSGVVADGYLEKAKVFLDLNDDKAYTPGEPTATTAADGSYTLTGVSADDLKKHAIVVLAEQNVTINHEGGNSATVADAYVLSTPPDAPRNTDGKVVITPLTTLIHSQIESNPALNVAAAEANVKANLGVGASASLFEDFVQKKGASDDYDKLSKVSQVVASAIGNNMTAIHDAAPDANLNDVLKVIVAQVMTQLATISTTVDTAGSFDPASIATATVTVNTSDSNALQDSLSQAGTATVTSSFKTALGTDGFFSIDREYFSETQYSYYYGVVKLGAATSSGAYALTEDDFVYSYFTPTWTSSTKTSKDYSLTSNGWAAYDDRASAGTMVFNADGTATWTLTATGQSQVISVSEVDVAGKSIKMFVKDVSMKADAVFPAGSRAYKMTFVPQSDLYKIWGKAGNADLTVMSSVAQIVTDYAVGSQRGLSLGGNMMGANFSVKFSGNGTTGTTQFYYRKDYNSTPALLDLTGTWKIAEPVAGYPVLTLDVPFTYKSQYMGDNPARGVIFAKVKDQVLQGSVEYANVPRDDKGMNFNLTAFTAIKDNFAPTWFTGTSPGAAKLAKALKKTFSMM